MARTVYAFGDYELDTERFELRRGGVVCRLEPQVLDLLLHLVKHRDRLVTKKELHDVIWSGRVVSDSALSTRINAARQAIQESGSKAGYIQTVFRRGFRFVGPVKERQLAGEADEKPLDAGAGDRAIVCGSFGGAGVAIAVALAEAGPPGQSWRGRRRPCRSRKGSPA